ncbi:MAG: DUF1998 domain-containing protein [Myxococcales bacterium]|nr:DUF1998 domain-containing protein [Myxococcales bacterium]
MARFGKSKKSGKTELRPDAHVRQSQMVGGYGAGAMIDLLHHAVIVSGLEDWRYEGLDDSKVVINESRLRDRIAERHPDLARQLANEGFFRRPPQGDDNEASSSVGIKVLEFPAWFVCQGCSRLLRRDELAASTKKDGRRYHECDRDRRSLCVPVRFVGACAAGHLQDLPWRQIAHFTSTARCTAPELFLEEDATGDFGRIRVSCGSCESVQLLATLVRKDQKLPCDGKRPWLPRDAEVEACDQPLRLLVRTASNGYFPLVVSALSVPDPQNQLFEEARQIEKNFRGQSPELRRMTLEQSERYQPLVAQFGIDPLLEAIEVAISGKTPQRKALRTAEYEQFLRAPELQTGESYSEDEDFVVREVPAPSAYARFLDSIVIVPRLREVRAQFGFTRLEPPMADNQGEFDDLNIKAAPLSVKESWLPATTVQGEGLFLQLSSAAIAEWEARSAVKARAAILAAAYDKWALQLREPSQKPPFLGARFFLLHSLAHMLITAISIECGYSASAIRERIYCGPYGDDPTDMAGILLYTGTVGSEGTLGGLVDQHKRLATHLDRAREMAALCSNDPICATHDPSTDHAERFLEGAACHGCLFISEPSCERFNRHLDRTLVVPVVGGDPNTAFFPVLDYV